MWNIIYYETSSKVRPVEEYMLNLSPKERAKLSRNIMLVEEFGPSVGDEVFKKIGDDIWEVRARFGKLRMRVLSFIDTKRKIILLHGVNKEKSKLKRKDIETAIARMENYLRRVK